MSNEEKKCPQKWDQAQLLAYIERDMDKSVREELEAHLKSCETCASEVESLRKMNFLLKHHTGIFHPDEQQLYRYAIAGEDPDGEIEFHLGECESCQEDVTLLKEMMNVRSAPPEKIPTLPKKLLRRIEQLYPATASESIWKRLYSAAEELFSAPFRTPKLALGTAAALVVLAIISIPLWEAFKSAPRPGLDVSVQESPSQKPEEVAPSGTNQYRQDLEKGKLVKKPERFRAEPEGGSGAPLSPAPAMRYAPEQRFEKSDHPSEGRVSSKLEGAPAQMAPSPTVKMQSHPSTVGAVPQTEKEGLVQPRASRPAMPASPMKKQATKQRYPTTVEQAKPEAAGPPSSVSDSRIPVRIEILDSEGKSIPGIKFQFPEDLESRYRLQGTESASIYRITIWIKKRAGEFDLSASLFEPNSTRASRTVQALAVPDRDWQDRIPSLISSLLENK